MRIASLRSRQVIRFSSIPTTESRSTGSFILIDPISNATVAAGMIFEDRSKSSVVEPWRDSTEPHAPGHLNGKVRTPWPSSCGFFDSGRGRRIRRACAVCSRFRDHRFTRCLVETRIVANVFDLLYSAGLLVLIDADALGADVKHLIEEESLERSIFDLSGNANAAIRR